MADERGAAPALQRAALQRHRRAVQRIAVVGLVIGFALAAASMAMLVKSGGLAEPVQARRVKPA
jgi:hypothetical protein